MGSHVTPIKDMATGQMRELRTTDLAGGGGGSGGGGDASAANQTTQIARADTANSHLVDIKGKLKATGAGNPLYVPGVEASDGTLVPVESLAQALTYDGSGNLSTVSVVWGGLTYTQTFSYTSGKLSGISAWVKQ